MTDKTKQEKCQEFEEVINFIDCNKILSESYKEELIAILNKDIRLFSEKIEEARKLAIIEYDKEVFVVEVCSAHADIINGRRKQALEKRGIRE